ncbi:phosphatidylinositol 3,4,5-trisphosphate 3-phosphatase and protein-tyrosine-phosphatase PTEN2A [Prosopis cineraria]|uniref:phosphatidylinositol 3,4,5-trisphosphate 3-phosphatase and protein-tyrosine-phosphatase PTEN2A n=1 Tax=Prosopis cineraria TaxID=364024 RepID=UPI0024107AE5|nr:phosphatidylinositol 3,4,5-trisphosphate 3-phosphatase and protein-tyrosine-phosphatase PTEN2A [Prosopis cineraria]XP_054786417.1 phosphatidylinositol 3,4,5-trisphosphate 3-phosphatase and protein-tyrosine-phosphatase PTEN2A [Prosopis cineraria]
MDSVTADAANLPPAKGPSTAPSVKDHEGQTSPPAVSGQENSAHVTSPTQSSTGISLWARSLKIPQPFSGSHDDSSSENPGKSTFARFTNNLAMRLSPKPSSSDDSSNEAAAQSNLIESFAKGLVDSSRNAVKAVQVKARHVVSQNKRRYQEGGFDLDMTYITENIIAMGFPAGDLSSGFFGYVEGLYRNHMEEVIKFFETHHKGKYKVYNLCSERLYDASLFEGKVASFPFDDHNCPPMQLVISFCQSAYAWLKQDIENVVVVHCKAGMARTGLMISSLLLFLKFFPTAEESIDYYNQKRCFDGKGLVLPSQIRYVKYFERVLTYFNGENPPARRCMLRGFRLHRCPYWIRPSITVSNHSGVLFSTKKHPRTKDLNPEDFWFSAPKKGVMVFALPGDPGLTELAGDFKIHFHDRQGDFYCWLNTTMTENRKILNTSDLDGFDKRKLPSPGFLVEVVLVDYNGNVPTSNPETVTNTSEERPSSIPAPVDASTTAPKAEKESQNHDKDDDVFSDGESEDSTSRSRQAKATPGAVTNSNSTTGSESTTSSEMKSVTHATEEISLGPTSTAPIPSGSKPKGEDARTVSSLEAPSSESEFKAMAADASVFTFGDDEDYESE